MQCMPLTKTSHCYPVQHSSTCLCNESTQSSVRYTPVEMWWHTVTHGRGSEGETGEYTHAIMHVKQYLTTVNLRVLFRAESEENAITLIHTSLLTGNVLPKCYFAADEEPQNGTRRRTIRRWGTVELKCDGIRWSMGGKVKGKLANGVGSQYPSHYLGTWCIQHYCCWCAHLGHQ